MLNTNYLRSAVNRAARAKHVHHATAPRGKVQPRELVQSPVEQPTPASAAVPAPAPACDSPLDLAIASLKELAHADFQRADRFYFLGLFRRALIRENFDVSTAEEVALHLPPLFADGSLTRKQMIELSNALATILAKTDDMLYANGFDNTVPFLINTVVRLSADLQSPGAAQELPA